MTENKISIALPGHWAAQFVSSEDSSKRAAEFGVDMRGVVDSDTVFIGTEEALAALGLIELNKKYLDTLRSVRNDDLDRS